MIDSKHLRRIWLTLLALLLAGAALISGRLYDRFGIRMLLQGGFFFITVIALLLTVTISFHTSYILLVVAYALLLLGIGFMLTPITAYAMMSVPHDIIRHASPMTITLRMLSSSMGGALLVTIMTATSSVSFSGSMLEGIRASFGILTFISGIGFVFSLYLSEHSKLDDATL
ncbi:MFS transporter [Paenibacillus sp. 23TSA30-6]|nr:MFS transporter [Paenibacillus sp. 23TSA30-6]